MNLFKNMHSTGAPIKARSLGGGYWYWIDKDILHIHGRKLKATGIAVYNVLAAFSNSKTQKCFPSHARIARTCGVSNRSVVRKIKQLEELGLIQVERKGKARTYCLLARK
ncbi:helix-turn-helix domain-containing protein [Candidatus Nomurabacteria bacterium]|nr:helix-turn-helix domain-containing protein [Candidatus Nomurabacteria bacterium]